MLIQVYLFYEGRCEEAVNFYHKALGAEIQMMLRYSESPEKPDPSRLAPGSENKIMHASLKVGNSVLMMSDGGCMEPTAKFAGFSVSLMVDNKAQADKIFAGLSDGGTVHMPLGETFFAKYFGMVVDRFGVMWMLNMEK